MLGEGRADHGVALALLRRRLGHGAPASGGAEREIEGAGYTDMSELRDRKYFKSIYVRSPGGALFELAVTHNEGGWDCDESPQEIGKRFQLPEQFEARRDEILGRLEPIDI
ncbi:hypothetical protein AB0K15_30155 [Amycolatopsis sp. NPDC049253]|uniref:hypothetical protein n=1 Tax=Amycolatopsis sp. NPDC049253 TaxID=3155274 RepID=UPI0034154B0F